MMQIPSLQGQVALVTGAGRGIGRAIALELARAGATVALTARTEPELQTLAEAIRSEGGQAAVFPSDLNDDAQVIGLIAAVAGQLGRLDILVNNAGTSVNQTLEKSSTDDFDLLMRVNLRAPFLLCRESIPHLRAQGGGFIVNIASVVAVKGYANQALYAASKHALLGMSKSLAREVQPDHIRVHVICPGGVATEMVTQMRPDLDPSGLIQPHEIAETVVFLVTRRGRAAIDQIDVRRDTNIPWA